MSPFTILWIQWLFVSLTRFFVSRQMNKNWTFYSSIRNYNKYYDTVYVNSVKWASNYESLLVNENKLKSIHVITYTNIFFVVTFPSFFIQTFKYNLKRNDYYNFYLLHGERCGKHVNCHNNRADYTDDNWNFHLPLVTTSVYILVNSLQHNCDKRESQSESSSVFRHVFFYTYDVQVIFYLSFEIILKNSGEVESFNRVTGEGWI